MQRSLPLYDTPTALRRAALAAVVFGVLGVLGWRIAVVRTPPTLSITTPAATLHATASRMVTVSGTTDPGAAITINGSRLAPDANGAFSVEIVLLPGVNTIAIEARRRHSRPARIERMIEVERNDAPVAWNAR